MNKKGFGTWCEHHIRRTVKMMSFMGRTLALLVVLTFIVGCLAGLGIGNGLSKKKTEDKVAQAMAEVKKEERDKLQAVEKELFDLKEQQNKLDVNLPWNLTLVNHSNPMEEGYIPRLKELKEGYEVDTRIAQAAKSMLTDAKDAGMEIEICSAYRSVERQEQVFSESMQERVKDGMSYWDAYSETITNVAKPGTSEHALGLALDLISDQYAELDERQENTKEAKWLAENCHKYGFILRYPPEKTAITGIIYEPWHYRYVGVEHSTEIMRLGVTLEEYLQNYYQPQGGE